MNILQGLAVWREPTFLIRVLTPQGEARLFQRWEVGQN